MRGAVKDAVSATARWSGPLDAQSLSGVGGQDLSISTYRQPGRCIGGRGNYQVALGIEQGFKKILGVIVVAQPDATVVSARSL